MHPRAKTPSAMGQYFLFATKGQSDRPNRHLLHLGPRGWSCMFFFYIVRQVVNTRLWFLAQENFVKVSSESICIRCTDYSLCSQSHNGDGLVQLPRLQRQLQLEVAPPILPGKLKQYMNEHGQSFVECTPC
jgi:hypothetical protein